MRTQHFDVYINTFETGTLKCADLVLAEESSGVERCGWRYSSDFLNHQYSFPVDPRQLGLSPQAYEVGCHRGILSVLDDYLPDAWGRKLLTRLAFTRDQVRLNAHSVIDMIHYMQGGRIGALNIVPHGDAPSYKPGIDLGKLHDAESLAYKIESGSLGDVAEEEFGLLLLARSGSGVGGARPKALLSDERVHYLAKFNHSSDQYNNARVELACLNMARAAGIPVCEGRVMSGINERDVLLLKRFDIDENNSRRHLITINGLLKNTETQADHGGVFTYNGIHKLLQKYSCEIQKDSVQLLKQMVFNKLINNLDDHERNFSMIHNGAGYTLSPAYDLVPILARGQYPCAGYEYSPFIPSPQQLLTYKSIFGLPRAEVQHAIEEVVTCVNSWSSFADDVGLSEEEMEKIQSFFCIK